MQAFVRNLLSRQRKRAVAIIMRSAEQGFYDQLTATQQDAFRSTVLAAIGSYHDACIDLVESSVNDGMMLNEHAVQVLADFNEAAQRMQRIETLSPLIYEPKREGEEDRA